MRASIRLALPSPLAPIVVFRFLSSPPLTRTGIPSLLAAAVSLAAVPLASAPVRAGALFAAAEVDQDRFVLVAAPIGSGPRSQLNIYEQVSDRRPCFAVGEGRPAAVNPLLASFDFSGVCSRYIDANGYSVRIGGSDLATSYRLMVSRDSRDTLLLAVPTRTGAGPEMVVARTQGLGSGFLKFDLEPGWSLKRRQFGARRLGHIYLYRDGWPGAATEISGAGAEAPLELPADPLDPAGAQAP